MPVAASVAVAPVGSSLQVKPHATDSIRKPLRVILSYRFFHCRIGKRAGSRPTFGMEIVMKKLSLLIAFLAAGMLVGCNTM